MNSAPHSENHPLDSHVARVHALANEHGETGPEADTIHTATTDGSPIVGWLLIRYLVLPLSQIYLTHRPAQPTTPLSPAPTAVGVYYAPRPTAADCEWRYAHSRDTAR